MKLYELLPRFDNTNYEITIEIPNEDGSHSFLYGNNKITAEILRENVCCIIPYERLNRLVICITTGDLICNSTMYLKML